MVCKPPCGVRLDEQQRLALLYLEIGAALKRRFAGSDCWFLSADTALPKGLGLKLFRKPPLFNGSLECRLYGFRMVAGSNRREKGGGLASPGFVHRRSMADFNDAVRLSRGRFLVARGIPSGAERP